MVQILDSDWSRRNLLRSDWLGPSVAMCTTQLVSPLFYYYIITTLIRLARHTWSNSGLYSLIKARVGKRTNAKGSDKGK